MAKAVHSGPRLGRETVRKAIFWSILLAMAAVAVAGPSGVMAGRQNLAMLDQRQAELAQLTRQRDEIRNRVDRLDPSNVDPDLAGELVRSRLNVAHPDEKVMVLH
jgi:cell division protein FtsB